MAHVPLLGAQTSCLLLLLFRDARTDLPHSFLPTLRLFHAVANERHEQRRYASDCEHRAPTIARANRVVGNGCQKDTEVITRVHQSGAHLSSLFRPFLGDEGAAHRPLAANAHAGQQPEDCQLPDTGSDCAKKCERRVANDCEHERANAPEPISDRSPGE